MGNSEFWKGLYEDISMDENGNINCVIVTADTPIVKAVSEYGAIQLIELSPEGYLMIYLA